jgi:hypothetical protein
MKKFLGTMVLSVFMLVSAHDNSIDNNDLPSIQKEQFNEKVVLSGSQNMLKWDSIEQCLSLGLTKEERETYLALKDEFIMVRAKIMAGRDSIAALPPKARAQAIKDLKEKIILQLNGIEVTVQSRLSMEQKGAKEQQKAEIERKRAEIKNQIQAMRERIISGIK